MDETRLPRWSAPLVGTIMGVGFVCSRLNLGNELEMVVKLAVGAGMGAAAGCLIWLVDSPAAPSIEPSEPSAGATSAAEVGLVPRVMAIVSVLVCWAPVIGLVVSGATWFACRRRNGWPRNTARTMTILGLVFWLGAFCLLALNGFK